MSKNAYNERRMKGIDDDRYHDSKASACLDRGHGRAYIRLPLSQVDEVTRLLDHHAIRHWVEENSISLNGGPYMSIINLGREGNAQTVQAILVDAR